MEAQPFRMISTAIIWAAITTIMVAMIVTGTELNFLVVGILAGAAWFATDAVWSSAKGESNRAAITRRVSATVSRVDDKDKRDQRMERLVSELSPEERRQLRNRLVRDDGELVSMDDLMDEQAEARRVTRG